MDIDGYNGSEFSYIDNNTLLDNSSEANVDTMFEITQVKNHEVSDASLFENRVHQDQNIENMISPFPHENEDEIVENMISPFPHEDEGQDQDEDEDQNIENMISPFPHQNIEHMENSGKKMGYSLLVFLVVWIILGIIAFIMSIVCFGFSGSMIEKVIGLLLACFFGPFYWLYFYFNKSYCGKK